MERKEYLDCLFLLKLRLVNKKFRKRARRGYHKNIEII
jgi:hypothetical protein